MISDFQLAAITKRGREHRLLRVPLHQNLQDALARSWYAQYQEFVSGAEEIPFDAGYDPEPHERFVLADYDLPDWLEDETSQTVPELDAISDNDSLLDRVKGILGFARINRHNWILFQNFSRSHIIQPGRFLYLSRDTYRSVQKPALTLDGKLSAIYSIAESKLLFRNFRTTNTFLPLADFYHEASVQEIRDVLSHDMFAPEDVDLTADNCTQWTRKRFAMLSDSSVLDDYTAQQLVEYSDGYDVDIQLDGDKVVFPADKAAAKRLLQYLNEEVFRGPITDKLYESNSKREADQ